MVVARIVESFSKLRTLKTAAKCVSGAHEIIIVRKEKKEEEIKRRMRREFGD